MLTNPEEISEDLLEAIGCGLRDPSPCPVCGTLSALHSWPWKAKNGTYYRAYFCKEHSPADLRGTMFEEEE